MISSDLYNLTNEEIHSWNNFQNQRIKEILETKNNLNEENAKRQSWFEFLQLKWGFLCEQPINKIDPLEYSLINYEFGPDLRAINLNFEKKTKNYFLKNQINSKFYTTPFNYFFEKKINLYQNNLLNFKEICLKISNEWKNLNNIEKEKYFEEWKLQNIF